MATGQTPCPVEPFDIEKNEKNPFSFKLNYLISLANPSLHNVLLIRTVVSRVATKIRADITLEEFWRTHKITLLELN